MISSGYKFHAWFTIVRSFVIVKVHRKYTFLAWQVWSRTLYVDNTRLFRDEHVYLVWILTVYKLRYHLFCSLKFGRLCFWKRIVIFEAKALLFWCGIFHLCWITMFLSTALLLPVGYSFAAPYDVFFVRCYLDTAWRRLMQLGHGLDMPTRLENKKRFFL